MVGLGLIFAGLGLCFLLVVAYSAGAIGRWIGRRPDSTRLLQRAAGGILMGLGLRLAFSEQR
jgi:threonine/homoserine/homoserine lactone efflux protein